MMNENPKKNKQKNKDWSRPELVPIPSSTSFCYNKTLFVLFWVENLSLT